MTDITITLTDEELLLRLTNFEDHFVERKTVGDKKKDWLKTAVAFANSIPIAYPGILFIGVTDKGLIEGNVNLDKLQKSFSETMNDAYPPVYYATKILNQDGGQCLAVIIPGSPLRPHFAGHSYIRVGSESRKSSEKQLDELIFQRTSKATALIQMVGQTVVWEWPDRSTSSGTLTDVNQFYLTIDGGTYKRCFPLHWVTISFDPTNSLHYLYIAR